MRIGHSEKGKDGFIDTHTQMGINPQFDFGMPFSDGLAEIIVGGDSFTGKRGYIDRTGKFVINPQFGWASPFKEGLAAVCIGQRSATTGKWGYISR